MRYAVVIDRAATALRDVMVDRCAGDGGPCWCRSASTCLFRRCSNCDMPVDETGKHLFDDFGARGIDRHAGPCPCVRRSHAEGLMRFVGFTLLLVLVILAMAIGANAQIVSGAGTSSYTITKTCTIIFKSGNVTTTGCDFSLPLRSAKFTSEGFDHFKIEFDQTPITSSTSTILLPSR